MYPHSDVSGLCAFTHFMASLLLSPLVKRLRGRTAFVKSHLGGIHNDSSPLLFLI